MSQACVGVRLGQGLDDGHLVLIVLGGAETGVMQAKVILESINKDDDSLLEYLWRLVAVPGGAVCMVGQHLGSKQF